MYLLDLRIKDTSLFRNTDSPASTWTIQSSLDNADAGRPLAQDCPAPLIDSPTGHYTNTGTHSSSLWLSFLAIVKQGRALDGTNGVRIIERLHVMSQGVWLPLILMLQSCKLLKVILEAQVTQICSMDILRLTIDFIKMSKGWSLCTEFYGAWQLLAMRHSTPYFGHFYKINHKVQDFQFG